MIVKYRWKSKNFFLSPSDLGFFFFQDPITVGAFSSLTSRHTV